MTSKKCLTRILSAMGKNVLPFSFCVGWLYIMRSHTFKTRRSSLAPRRKQFLFVSLAHTAFELPTWPYLLFKVAGGDTDLLLSVHSKTHPWINNETSTADRHLYKTDTFCVTLIQLCPPTRLPSSLHPRVPSSVQFSSVLFIWDYIGN